MSIHAGVTSPCFYSRAVKIHATGTIRMTYSVEAIGGGESINFKVFLLFQVPFCP